MDGVNSFSCEARVDYVLIMTLGAIIVFALITTYGAGEREKCQKNRSVY